SMGALEGNAQSVAVLALAARLPTLGGTTIKASASNGKTIRTINFTAFARWGMASTSQPFGSERQIFLPKPLYRQALGMPQYGISPAPQRLLRSDSLGDRPAGAGLTTLIRECHGSAAVVRHALKELNDPIIL